MHSTTTMVSSNSLLPTGLALTSYSLRRSSGRSVSGASLCVAITALHYTATTGLQHRSTAPERRIPEESASLSVFARRCPKRSQASSRAQGCLPACLPA
ncbi:hypothetical protein BDW69DRAFT_158299 [Aspergillus filifer]